MLAIGNSLRQLLKGIANWGDALPISHRLRTCLIGPHAPVYHE